MAFVPAIVMVDMQLEHATKASLPSPRFPGEQGWYFNQGEKAGHHRRLVHGRGAGQRRALIRTLHVAPAPAPPPPPAAG